MESNCPLNTREITFLSQFILRIHRTENYKEFCEVVLSQITNIISFRKGILFQISEIDNALSYSDPVALNNGDFSFVEDEFMTGKYRSAWLMNTSFLYSTVFRASDIREEDTFTDSSLYKAIYEPQNIYYGIQAIMVAREKKLGLLGIFRSKEEGDFTERDVFVINTLLPHLEYKLAMFKENIGIGGQSKLADFSAFDLTKKELEIVQLIAEGKTSKELAESLYISKSTLDKHLYNIYRKFNVKGRLELIHLLHRGGEYRE